MKKILILMSLVFSAACFAQSKPVEIKLPIKCYAKDVVLQGLEKDFKEKIIFAGIDDFHKMDDLSTFITWNSDTETFTVGLYSVKEEMICIVSGGFGNFIKKQ